jgi:hypothetical protein
MSSVLVERCREKIKQIVMQYLFYVGDGRKARSMMTKEVQDLTTFVDKFVRYALDTKSVLESFASGDVDITNENYFVNRSKMINFALEIIPVMKEMNSKLNVTYEIKKVQPQTSKIKWLYFTFYAEKDKEKFQTYDENQDDFYEDYVTDTEMNAQDLQVFATALYNLQQNLTIISKKVALMY